MYEENQHRRIVGTGAVWLGWVAPCGRPSSPFFLELLVLSVKKFGMTHVNLPDGYNEPLDQAYLEAHQGES